MKCSLPAPNKVSLLRFSYTEALAVSYIEPVFSRLLVLQSTQIAVISMINLYTCAQLLIPFL
jgi:hypothetical protein